MRKRVVHITFVDPKRSDVIQECGFVIAEHGCLVLYPEQSEKWIVINYPLTNIHSYEVHPYDTTQ